jgi:hypothetical protein
MQLHALQEPYEGETLARLCREVQRPMQQRVALNWQQVRQLVQRKPG